ncbi:hypothetical protein NC652_025442 [Populus alba x Populus x berolinensis]|uniref:Uncharacterized protein n=1 Tax=Populus alba x Populus x berolinensis TaxID=444605 RepID=A0AAD6MCR4_9ROSI|nr:hypothetical protein NC652_025442 [Populus alba x Populus x berolinensis]KAJ6981842.1 hypothetical protein NC653_025062 [Populus alba x Populus x berolinensis]
MPFGNYIIRSSRNQRGKEDLLFSSLQVLSSAHVKAKLLCPLWKMTTSWRIFVDEDGFSSSSLLVICRS